MATTTSSAWKELAELDDRIRAARDRVSAAEAAKKRGRRDVGAAKGRLADYFAAVEAEDRPADRGEEATLIAAIAQAEASDSATVKESRLTAASERLQELEQEREAWGFANVARLVAELAPKAVAAKTTIEETHEAHRRAVAEFQRVRRLSVRVAVFAGLEASDVPLDPDRGTDVEVASRYARGDVELPLPRTMQR